MKKLLIIICMLFISTVAVADDQAFIDKAELSLNNLKTAGGIFKQYNPDGSIFMGEFWISKPGKMRFEYSYPNNNFIVSNGSFIFYWDEDLQQQTNAPLSYTPASMILDDEIELGGDIEVKAVIEKDDYFAVELVSKDNKDMGFVSLMFDRENNELIQWKITEMSGSETIVSLQEVKFNENLDDVQFRFKDPRRNPFELN